MKTCRRSIICTHFSKHDLNTSRLLIKADYLVFFHAPHWWTKILKFNGKLCILSFFFFISTSSFFHFFHSFLLPPPVCNCEICPCLSLKCSVGLEHSYNVASKPRTGQKRSQKKNWSKRICLLLSNSCCFHNLLITEQRTTRQHSTLSSAVKTSPLQK